MVEELRNYVGLNNEYMTLPYTEKSLATSIACLKWSQNLACYSCGSREFYYRKDLSRKCKFCKSNESITVHTAFHRQKLKIDTAIDILLSIQYRIATDSAPYLTPVAHVSGEFRLPKPTVYKFLKRIHAWLPADYYNRSTEVPQALVYNSVRNDSVYYSLYHLLFDDWHTKRSLAEIISLLTLKEIRPIELRQFLRFLHKVDIADFQYEAGGFYFKVNQLKNKRTYLG